MKKWSGQLPRRNYKNPSYSTKVFLGGVPWDITEGNYTLLIVLCNSCDIVWHVRAPFSYSRFAKIKVI